MSPITRREILASTGALLMSAALPAASQQTKDFIKLGVITPLSGSQKILGDSVVAGAEIARDYINANGGVNGRNIELIIRDSKANPADGLAAARELLTSGIKFTLGGIISPVVLALPPLLTQYDGIHITSGAATDKINHENYNEHVFRVSDSAYSRNYALAARLLDEYPDINTWGGFMPDHEYGRTLWAIITDAFARHKEKNPNRSLKLIEAVWVPYGAGDYKNYITKMMGSPVEGLFNTAYGGDAVTLYRQAAPYGLFDKVRVIGDPANELLIPGTMKSEMPKNYWICPYWYEGLNRDNPISVDLYDKYVTKTANKSPSGWIAEGHAAVLAYAKAISIAGPDAGTRAIIATLKGMDFMSASGSRKVRPEDNQAIAPIHIMKLQPDSGSELGYKVELQYKTDGSKEIEPPNPGKPLALKKL